MAREIKGDHTKKKHIDIRKDFQKWSEKKYKKVQIHTNEYIFIKLAEKYYLTPPTIEKIVFHRY